MRTLTILFCVLLASCGGGSGGGATPTTDIYLLDVSRTFSLEDPRSAKTAEAREAIERANAQALAVGGEGGIQLLLHSDGQFTFKMTPTEHAVGTWTQDGPQFRLETTALEGQPVTEGLAATTASLGDDDVLTVDVGDAMVYLRKQP